MSDRAPTQCTVHESFREFERVFTAVSSEFGDDAAQVVVHRNGVPVVDLHSGSGSADSVLALYSTAKVATYVVVAMLVDRGLINLDQPIKTVWPEFAAGGKDDVTLRTVLAHRAGLVGVPGGFSLSELMDDAVIAGRLAQQRPYWRPDTAHGYHALVLGAIIGETIVRATGSTVRQIYEAEIRQPLDIDLYLGLPERHEDRFAKTLPPVLPRRATTSRNSLLGLAVNASHDPPTAFDSIAYSREFRAAGQLSIGGIGSARGLADLYSAYVFGRSSHRLVSSSTVAEFAQIHSHGRDLVTGAVSTYGLGFELLAHQYQSVGFTTIGHGGAGGSLGFADPSAGLTFAYVRQRYPNPGEPRGDVERLVEALYACV